MCSIDEIRSYLSDPEQLTKYLREKSSFPCSDEIYGLIVEFYRFLPLTNENLCVQRNLYGRIRSTPMTQIEIDVLIENVRQCLSSTDSKLTTTFVQYLHNIQRLISNEFEDFSYLCSLFLRSIADKNVLSCVFSAFIDKNASSSIRFDLIINSLFDRPLNDENEEKSVWIKQLAKLLIDNDRLWLRKLFLEKIYVDEFLQIVDQHQREKFFTFESFRRLISTSNNEKQSVQIDFHSKSIKTLEDLYLMLKTSMDNDFPIETIDVSSLFHLFSSSDGKTSPHDLHLLFICFAKEIYDQNNYSLVQLRFFRHLTSMMIHYYVHQEDLFDDNDFRLDIVFVLCHLLREVHRRRSSNEHLWYRLYIELPTEHPLPTFDFFSDLLRLLATLCYDHIDCQDLVRNVDGTIESILSMTQIDLNQPKSSPSVIWLIKCLTEKNEQNRIYFQQIR